MFLLIFFFLFIFLNFLKSFTHEIVLLQQLNAASAHHGNLGILILASLSEGSD